MPKAYGGGSGYALTSLRAYACALALSAFADTGSFLGRFNAHGEPPQPNA